MAVADGSIAWLAADARVWLGGSRGKRSQKIGNWPAHGTVYPFGIQGHVYNKTVYRLFVHAFGNRDRRTRLIGDRSAHGTAYLFMIRPIRTFLSLFSFLLLILLGSGHTSPCFAVCCAFFHQYIPYSQLHR